MTLRMREIEKLQEGRLEGIEIGTQKGIVNAIAMLKGFSVSDGDIVKSLMQQYSLSREQAENYIEKYKTSG